MVETYGNKRIILQYLSYLNSKYGNKRIILQYLSHLNSN